MKKLLKYFFTICVLQFVFLFLSPFGRGGVCFSQQLPQFSQYLINDYVINPAIGGSRPYFEAKANQRYQWVGITDAPRTYIFSLQGPLANRKMGVGGYLFSDVTGPTRRTGGQLSYSYHFKVSEDIKISLGVFAGILQFAIDGGKISAKETGDIAMSAGFQSTIVPDAGAGIYIFSKTFYFGASVPQLFNNKLQFFEGYSNTPSRLVYHYNAMGGYKYEMNEKFTIEPSVLVRYVSPAPPQFEPSLRFWYQKKLWLAGSYRTSDAIVASIGYILQENIMFGYSYDMTTSNLKRYSSGTHELMIGFRFKKSTFKPKPVPETPAEGQ